MSTERIRTKPNLADTSPAHQQDIKDGIDSFSSWQFNVADHFKGKSVEEIRQSLKETALPCAVLMENWENNFNFSSLIRNANGFNVKAVYYIGDKKFDRRGSVGCINYSEVNFLSTIDDLIKLQDEYVFVGVDNIPGSISLAEYKWAPNPLFILGSESAGLTPALQSLCKDIVHINMSGSVRSFNAATASGIVMYDFSTKFNRGI